MNARHLIVTLALLTGAVQEAAGELIPCWPGECDVQNHREMVLTAHAEVDPKLDAVVVGRIEAVRHLYGNDEVGATELLALSIDVAVDRSLAGCVRAGDRLALSAHGYGGWHWQERSLADMAPVLAIAEANMELERQADERDDRHFLIFEVPKHLKLNRERLIALGVARRLPFVVLRVRDNDLPSLRRRIGRRASSWPVLPDFHAEHRRDESIPSPPKQLRAHVRHLPGVLRRVPATTRPPRELRRGWRVRLRRGPA